MKPGRYLLQPLEPAPDLSAVEEEGLLLGLVQIAAGESIPGEQVLARAEATIKAKGRAKPRRHTRRRRHS